MLKPIHWLHGFLQKEPNASAARPPALPANPRRMREGVRVNAAAQGPRDNVPEERNLRRCQVMRGARTPSPPARGPPRCPWGVRGGCGSSQGEGGAGAPGTAQGSAAGAQRGEGNEGSRSGTRARARRGEGATRSSVERNQERQREGGTDPSPSRERHRLGLPRWPRGTFCCGRVFSMVDPNHRSQPPWAEHRHPCPPGSWSAPESSAAPNHTTRGAGAAAGPGARAASTAAAAVQHPRESREHTGTRPHTPRVAFQGPRAQPRLPRPPTLARRPGAPLLPTPCQSCPAQGGGG